MRVILSCGGTGGHITPALAIAEVILENAPRAEILFVGALGGMEEEVVSAAGYPIKCLRVRGFARRFTLDNLRVLNEARLAVREAGKLLSDFQPDIVIGTGGYVCWPVCKAASKMGIPVVLHESNAVPGLTTKMLAGSVDVMMLGFEESKAAYKNSESVVVTGTPVRGDFRTYGKESAKAELGLDPKDKLIVSVWGSLGAARMNEIMADFIADTQQSADFNLIHAAGRERYDTMMARLGALCPAGCCNKGFDVRPYIYDMSRVMAAADLVVCRAGASTIAELALMGKPCVLVPSPNVTNNHQEKNARVLEKAGGAVVLVENGLTSAAFREAVMELIGDEERLNTMADAMKKAAPADATERITDVVLSLVAK